MNPPADRPASHNPQGHTVLLIDDDPTNLGVISDCLEWRRSGSVDRP